MRRAALWCLAAAAPECDGGGDAALREAALVPGWEHQTSFPLQLGGSTQCTFRVADVVVRLLRPGARDANITEATRLLAAHGLTPEVLGVNARGLVQRWSPGGSLRADQVLDNATAQRLGALVGRLHALPLTGGNATFLSPPSSPPDPDVTRRPVVSHGDLHYNNVVQDGTRLLFIDLERVAVRPAVTDLGQLFTSIRTGLLTEGHTLPPDNFPLPRREDFMRAYLAQVGGGDAEAWLWAVEAQTPRTVADFLGSSPRMWYDGLRTTMGFALYDFAVEVAPLAARVVAEEVEARAHGQPTRLVAQGALALALPDQTLAAKVVDRHAAIRALTRDPPAPRVRSDREEQAHLSRWRARLRHPEAQGTPGALQQEHLRYAVVNADGSTEDLVAQ